MCDSPWEMAMVNTAMDARRFHEKDALFIFLGTREPVSLVIVFCCSPCFVLLSTR